MRKKPPKPKTSALPETRDAATQATVEKMLADATPRMIEQLLERYFAGDMSAKEQTNVLGMALRVLNVREQTAKKYGLSKFAETAKARDITNHNYFLGGGGKAMSIDDIAAFVSNLHQPGMAAPKTIDALPEPDDV